MNIVLVEDDPRQAETIIREVKRHVNNADVTLIKTEWAFREHLSALAESPPDLVVLDVMLRWQDPSPNMVDPPEEVEREGFFKAGLRCARLLDEVDFKKKVPILLFTILKEGDLDEDLVDLPSNVVHLPKSKDLSILVANVKKYARGVQSVR